MCSSMSPAQNLTPNCRNRIATGEGMTKEQVASLSSEGDSWILLTSLEPFDVVKKSGWLVLELGVSALSAC